MQIVLTGEGSGQVNVTAMALGPAPAAGAGEPFAKSTYLSQVPSQKKKLSKSRSGNLTSPLFGPAGDPLEKSS